MAFFCRLIGTDITEHSRKGTKGGGRRGNQFQRSRGIVRRLQIPKIWERRDRGYRGKLNPAKNGDCFERTTSVSEGVRETY